MANKIWKEVFLIMCSSSRKNARNTERFSLSLRITDDYALQTLCCSPHNIANESGKINGLPLNRAIYTEDGDMQDIYAGDFLVVGLTEDDFGSLTSEQMQKFEEQFHQPQMFVRMGRSIMAIPVPDDMVKKMEEKAAKPQEKSKPAPDRDSL